MADWTGGDVGGDLGAGDSGALDISSGTSEVGGDSLGDSFAGDTSFESVEALDTGSDVSFEGAAESPDSGMETQDFEGAEPMQEMGEGTAVGGFESGNLETEDSWDSIEAFGNEDITDGVEEDFTDDTQEDVTDGTEEDVTDDTEEGVTDGTEEDITDGTEEDVTDGTEEGVTDSTAEDVTDGTEEDVIDDTEEGVTDDTEEDVTESTEEGVTDGTEEDATDGTAEDVTDGTEEDVTDGTEEDVTDGTEEDVTDGTEEDMTDGAEEDVTDGTEEDVTDGAEEDVTDSTEEDVTDDTEEDMTDGTEEDVTDGTEEDVTDSTEEDVTEGTEEDVTGGTEEDVTDGTEEDVTDDTEEGVTDDTEEAVTDGTEEYVTDGTEEDVTDSTEEDVTDDTEEDMTDGTEEDVTDGTEEDVTDSTEEDVTEGTEEDVNNGTEEDVTDSTEEDVTEGTEEDVTDGTEEDVTDGAEEDVTDDTEEDVTDGTEEDITDDTDENITDSAEEGATEAADDETDSAAAGDTTVGGVSEVDQNAAEGSEDEDSFRDLHTENMQAQQLENQEEEKQNSTELDRSKEPVLEKDEENPEHTENLSPPPHDPNNPENFSGPHGPKDPNNLDTPKDPENIHPEKLENPLKELPRHQQYELQKQENQRKLERAMDDAFGREGGRRMEMGRLVERVNELTAHRYELAQEISKQDPVLDKYTDHGPEHIKEVAANTLEYSQAFREFAQSQGIEPGSEADIKSDVLLTAALYHDTGMDGGLESIEEYQQKCAAHEAQELQKPITAGKIEEYGDVIRSGHPSQSAMHVLEDAKALQEKGIDPNEVAALTYLHSKSNSGVRVGDSPDALSKDMTTFMQRCEKAGIEVDTSTFAHQAIDAKGKPILDKDGHPTWEVTDKEAFVRREFEVAMQNLHGMAQDRRLDFDPSFLGKFDEKGNFTITNEQAYTRLQYETAVLRLADAQRPAQKFTTTHSGKTIELTEPDWEQRETKIANGQLPNTLASELNAVDARFTGPATGASVSSVESRLFTDPQQNRASWDVSKKFYTGESNVDRGQVFYNPESGKLEIEYRVKDGCKAPRATVEILRERMAECRMPVLDGKTEQIVVLERTTARSLRSYRRGIGSEKGCRVRV